VLFLDEVDALGLKRSHLERSAGRNVVVQLLSELDSARSDNEGVFVLGATNQPWDIDPALRRPGRFDRTLLVLPPDPPARVSILQYHLRDRPVGQLDLQRLANRTEGFSGADLRLLCESAAESALEDSLRSGTNRPIGPGDFDRAFREVSPSTRPWFDVARNYAMFANEGGVGRLGRAPLERWTQRGAPTADPKASPELMSALRRERRSLDPMARGTRSALRLLLIAVVAALALFFGSAFVVQAAASKRGAGDVALNALAAAGCAGVAALMFRLALRPGGTRRRQGGSRGE
jgi:ATPase family protein associated with various cellular activities (AAA)/AAA+ lid domain-containing protein